MKDLKDAILYVKTVNRTFQFDREELSCAFKHIFCYAMEKGLDDTSLKLLASMLTRTNLPFIFFEDLVKCMIPRTNVSDSVITDISLWLFSEDSDVTPAKISLVMRWLSGVIHNGLVESSKFENLYELFFNMIRKPGIESQACSFIQCITKQHYITRRHILMLIELQKKGKKKHFESLYGLFKHMKPDLVPENGIACHHPSLSTLEICEPGFQLAKERCALLKNSAVPQDVVNHPSSHSDRVHPCQNIIPQIIYSDPCYDHSQVYKLNNINSWESMGAYYVDLEMPCQSLALLRSSFGILTLAFGGLDIQRRFSLNLQSKLYSVFLNSEYEPSRWNPEERLKNEARLLHQLSTLQEYLHQPIPVVSCFISKYLQLWDGDTHRLLILRLLSYIHFSNFDELESCILDPLSLLFITKDIQFKCNVINMLKEFMKNLILKELWRQEKEPLFLGVKRCWQAEDILPKIFEFISDLIETGVSSENGDSFLLCSALSYYHTMATLQKDIGVNYLVTPPPSVIYHSLFSLNPVCLSLSCSLLVRYKTEIYPLLKDPTKVKETLGNLTVYVIDYVKFLCTDKPFLNRTEGYIFGNLKDSTIKSLSQLLGNEPSSGICNHIAFAPFHYVYSQTNTPANFEVLYQTAEKRFPGIAEFIKTFGSMKS